MNNRIIRIGLAAVAVAAVVVVGIVLLAGRGTGAQLTPSSAQAQAPGLASPVALAKAGGLDTSFGRDGKVVTNLTRGDDLASALAIQADGKIVVVEGDGFGVARYNSDGTLDASFSGDGRAFVHFTSGYDSASGVAMQADGKVVVVGQSGSYLGNRDDSKFALARLNGDGTLDATFGVNGKVMTDFTSGRDYATGVAIQADGRIVVVGIGLVREVRPRPLQQRRHPRRELRRRRQGRDWLHCRGGRKPAGWPSRRTAGSSSSARPGRGGTRSSPSPATPATAPSTRPSAATARC